MNTTEYHQYLMSSGVSLQVNLVSSKVFSNTVPENKWISNRVERVGKRRKKINR